MSRPWCGREIVFGPHARHGCCDHRVRVLGSLIDSLGRRHVADFCVLCGSRTQAIARRDLLAADIDWATIPTVRHPEPA